MAKKAPVKKAVALPGGGFQWAWDGTGGVRHEITWQKNGQTFWRVFHEGTLLREEQPWFLVRARGEVQENIKLYRDGDMDKILANRALLVNGLHPTQHTALSICNCGQCTGLCPF
jgi:hypothetical protein